jgi:hypothetical protein
MLKKIGLPGLALFGMLAGAPHSAKAAVRFGVVVGAPVVPVVPYVPPAVYPAPAYAYPYVTWGPGYYGHAWDHARFHRDLHFRGRR